MCTDKLVAQLLLLEIITDTEKNHIFAAEIREKKI